MKSVNKNFQQLRENQYKCQDDPKVHPSLWMHLVLELKLNPPRILIMNIIKDEVRKQTN